MLSDPRSCDRPWDFLVEDVRVGRQRVADAKAIVADEADDVAWERFVHRLAFVAEDLVGAGQAHLLPGAGVMHGHVALELAGANTDEGDAVAVLRVHVRLDLEDETGERRVFGRDKRRRGSVPASIAWLALTLR